jgi:hypothetical protein
MLSLVPPSRKLKSRILFSGLEVFIRELISIREETSSAHGQRFSSITELILAE